MNNLFQLLNFVFKHPSNKNSRFSALLRIIKWQISSRLMPGLIALPFVNDTYLFAKKGMTSASSAWYCGLYEYEEMSFLSHHLEPNNLFVDVGANIGAYSILAASNGSKVISIEPIPSTFEILKKNILLNNFQDLVELLNIGVDSKKKILKFTNDKGAMNHVLKYEDKKKNSINVNSNSLDNILSGRIPKFIKIDVEGFELNVIEGGETTLKNESLKGIIIELIGGGKYYGYDEEVLHEKILSYGFDTFNYDPESKKLISLNGKRNLTKNTIYLRKNFSLQK